MLQYNSYVASYYTCSNQLSNSGVRLLEREESWHFLFHSAAAEKEVSTDGNPNYLMEKGFSVMDNPSYKFLVSLLVPPEQTVASPGIHPASLQSAFRLSLDFLNFQSL